MTAAEAEPRHLHPVADQPQSNIPHDLGAEQVVLGAMMLSPEATDAASEVLRASDFYRANHGSLFSTILAQRDAGEPLDPAAITHRLVAAGEIAKYGPTYLHDLVSSVPTAANVGWYANVVREHAERRDLHRAAVQIAQVATSPGLDVAEARNLAEKALTEATVRGGRISARMWRDIIGPALAAIETASERSGIQGLSSGLKDLDRMLNGLRPGQLVIVGARPGMGKSIFAVDIARRAAMKEKIPTALFSLEMSTEELANRIISAETGIPSRAVETGRLSDKDWTTVARFAGELAEAPLIIEDAAPLTFPDLRTRARQLHRKHGLGLVIVDYLQLMASEEKKAENRAVEVADLSRGLKLLAKELSCPVVAASQLNRNPDSRADKRPQLSDLRESGGIENDADIVVLLHREDYYDPKSKRAGEVDLIVAKNRNGPLGTVVAAAQLHFTRFVDMAEEDVA
jgi:replicative DNA helicase